MNRKWIIGLALLLTISVGAIIVDAQTAVSIVRMLGAYNEDSVHTSGEPAIAMLGVRRDADTSPVGSDGDYHLLQFDNAGNLKVNIKAGAGSGGTASTDDGAFTAGSGSGTPMMGFATADTVESGDVGVVAMTTARALHTAVQSSALPTGASTLAEQQTQTTALQLIDDTIFADDAAFTPATSKVQAFGAQADETTPDSVDEGDVGAPRMTLTRKLWTVIGAQTGELSATVRDTGSSDSLNVAIVDGSGNQITSFGGSGGTSATDDGAFTIGAATSITPTGYLADEATPDSVNEGDVGVPRMSLNRVAYGIIRDAAGNERGANVDASGNLMVNLGVRLDATNDTVDLGGSALTALQLIDNIVQTEDTATADQQSGVPIFARRTASPANQSGSDGDLEWLQISAGRLWASATIDAALPAGNNNIGDFDVASFPDNEPFNIAQLGGTTLVTGGVAGTLGIGGIVAHDAAATSVNPVLGGLFAVAHGSDPTAVAASDVTRWIANRDGVPFVIAGHPNIVTLEAAYTAAQTDTAIITVSAGTKIVVTGVDVVADNANTVDVGYRVGFGTANTPTTTGVVSSHPGLAAGTGIIKGTGSGIIGIGADDADLRITSEVPTTGSIRVVVTYYLIES